MSIEEEIGRLETAVRAEIRRIGPSAAAKLAGCGRSYLCRISLGRVKASPKKLVALARSLGLKEGE